MVEKNNLAFVDGQNLYMGTRSDDSCWEVNLKKLRIYLLDKYRVKEAFYFLGCFIKDNNDLYKEIEGAGFILKFRAHNLAMLGIKKGNVDSDIIFQVMKKLYRKESFNKIILIYGDGDYKNLVDFLIEENRFEKILFPNKKNASSLYKKLTRHYFDYFKNFKHLVSK